ncbi:MAG: DUF2007 domain-containing protein [Bacteroidales bacterium]|nr:DUF2007 domain-containing protein [Bacteroidales bacterium]MBK7172369.1 DUF2007 domain-containing protein [Bacteroidales bacterium]
MDTEESSAPYQVYEGTAWESGLLLSILEDNEIPAFLKDVSSIPWNSFPVNSSSVKVFVAFRDYEPALKIVEEFTQNMQKAPETLPEE